MVFRFLHAADIHLDSPLKGLERYEGAPVDKIREASRRALERLVELAIERQVSFVLIAGDLYDGDWKEDNTGLCFTTQAMRLKEANIPLFLISGNHDAQSVITKTLRLPDNTKLLWTHQPQTIALDHLGVAIHGQGFATRAVFEDLSRAYPIGEPGLFNIGLLHTSFLGADGHEPYAPCTLDGLKTRQYQYWALGHVHNRRVLHETDPIVTFPGNIQGRHIRETGAKGCWIVEVDDRLQPTLEFVSLDVLRWERLVVPMDDLVDEDQLFEHITARLTDLGQQQHGLPLAVRIELTGRTRMHAALQGRRAHLRGEFKNTCLQVGAAEIWLEKLELHTEPVSSRVITTTSDDDPWSELQEAIKTLRPIERSATEIDPQLDTMLQRVGAYLKLSEAGLNLEDPAQRNALLDEAASLLTYKLAPTQERE